MSTQKENKTAKAKTQTKVRDLKPAKDAKGGSFGVTNTGTGGSNLGSGGGRASS